MSARLHPSVALHGAVQAFPALPPCVHYAGSERFVRKALVLQREMGPVFDVACDCEDGAPVGEEKAHAMTMGALIASEENAFARVGARVHDVNHPAWQSELDILLGEAGDRLAFLTLPKAGSAADVQRFSDTVRDHALRRGLQRTIPLSILIET